MRTRLASAGDASAIARIFNEGIEDRMATFETEPRSGEDIAGWISGGDPVVVGEAEGAVVAWAAAHEYRPRACYTGVGDYSVYVARERRGEGLGRPTLDALVEECERRGYWKLVSRIFPENEASLALARAAGFREVGVYRRHGRLNGEWRDCVI